VARLFTEASKLGNPSATYGLAYMHLVGMGTIKKDEEKAHQLFSEVGGTMSTVGQQSAAACNCFTRAVP
jgi:TPR repeat protein